MHRYYCAGPRRRDGATVSTRRTAIRPYTIFIWGIIWLFRRSPFAVCLRRGFPHAYRSRALLAVAAVLAVLVAVVVMSRILPPAYSEGPLGIAATVLFALIIAQHEWWAHRLCQRLERAAGRLCPRCTYELHGLPDHGVCPECGHEYDADAAAASWKRCNELSRWRAYWS